MDFATMAKKLKSPKTKREKKIATIKPNSLNIKKHRIPHAKAIPTNNPAKKSKSEMIVSFFIA
ncbi:hypothetical protein NHP200010_02290 [Helicobacter bizzozeronii]|nr:hypothetical protein NHP200010_02290 [Helicobacter bizzozeronii]